MAHTGTNSMKDDDDVQVYYSELVAAVLKAVEKERERCAQVCESLAGQQWVTREAALECSDAIRARGQG